MVKNKKTNTNFPPKRKYSKTNRINRQINKMEAIIPEDVPKQQKAEPFAFLGFPDQPFKAKMGVPFAKGVGRQHKHKHPMLIDDDDDEDIHPLRIPMFMPFGNLGAKREGNDGEDFCTEIVDCLRQNTNTLIDEIKESRKEAKQSSDSLISALKELQSELKKTLEENSSKLSKN